MQEQQAGALRPLMTPLVYCTTKTPNSTINNDRVHGPCCLDPYISLLSVSHVTQMEDTEKKIKMTGSP